MADVFDDEVEDVEQTISINELVTNMEEEELEADLVLGGDEGKECTYSKGYMKRQAIFSCVTCTPEGNAGVCTACSLSCHDGHEVVEIWTKRNFRCDCGNSKFGEFYCKLCPSKDVENAENSYNHNFKGLYCTCNLPYPDPDVEEQVEMIQCFMCEDWFHEEHLGLESLDEIPKDEEGEVMYEDFICKACSAVCSFLTLYPENTWAAGKQCNVAANAKKDKDMLEEIPSACVSEKLENDSCSPAKDNAMVNANKDKHVLEEIPSACVSGKLENGTCSSSSPRKENVMANANPESQSNGKALFIGESSEKNVESNHCIIGASSHTACLLGDSLVTDMPVLLSKPLFLSKNWRDILCRCEKCLDMYKQKHIGYLLDKEDSIVEYERTAKQKREEKLQQREGTELNLLDKFGPVKKMEILYGIADMENEFRTFLDSADTSKAITPDDIHQIFENLAKKRRRID